ncbi:MarR family transcriptional regulator [Methanospirillum sp.]|uniref:MarR family winged helix-turn-helix transcriptional regulator n=1 Tax=Methanospirillum sp. TaxID=45200 RepID=UPI002BB857C3|nr:MarR family transcriptional regulator [Methanospirillum sp.]HPP77759.1 MarR family transcriptional regulator [Methanospirillum sp.]
MDEPREHLLRIFEHLIRLKTECSCGIYSECCLSDITIKQIAYLKIIDEHPDITFSQLAEITKNSKPTITGMIHKLSRMDCVYREPCPHDGRISYIRLTEKGAMVARAEQQALMQVIDRLISALDEQEIALLIAILNKVR